MLLPVLARLVFFFVAFAYGANITVDDTAAGWSFSPVAAFGSVSAIAPCSTCTSQVDPQMPFQKTWRDCVSKGTATLKFTGVGVTIYTICPGPHEGGVYIGHFSFAVDDKPQTGKDFVERTNGCPDYVYNYPVFSVSGLSAGDHTVSITNMDVNSNLLLDYAIVDTDGTTNPGNSPNGTPNKDNDDTQKKSSFPIAAVVVPVVVLILIAVIGIIFLVVRRRRRSEQNQLEEAAPTPYKASSLDGHDSGNMSEHRGQGVPVVDHNVSHDPELEAALQVIAARTRQNNSQTTGSPVSPGGPNYNSNNANVGWPRDRKGVRPSNSTEGQGNWSTNATGTASNVTHGTQGADDVYGVPPAYGA